MSQALEAVGVPFARDLWLHGDRLAVVAPDGTSLTYRELADRVSDVAARLGAERRLVHVTATNDVEPLVTYLAALQGGHPVLLAADESVISRYDPDVVLRPHGAGWDLDRRRPGTAHTLHPELAVLLSTSGSTGSPKLVRLSADNLQANAASIASYLDIRDTDRAIASLPVHYCYGLSVVNSNLLRGAAVVLTHESVVDNRFWDTVRRHRATSLHGVPYTFELLDTVGFDRMELPSLRYVTQAGGRLDPGRVRRYAELGRARGWRFFVMYGQTEATARMAYLPPELAASRPAAIGVPIPDGSFSLAPDGELIYRGPNVMLGYAERPADLALGRTVAELSTGDIARRAPDGLYEIVGRKSRFLKLFGLRIDLAQVERALESAGVTAACAGTDDALIVAAVRPRDPDRIRSMVSARCGLPAGRVRVVPVAALPRLPTGKMDHPAIERLGTADPARPAGRRTVRAAFARVLHRDDIPDDATFVSLGGDSLSYVRMSIELDKALGFVPDGWPNLPVARLERLRRQRGPFRAMETNIVLRALAIILIVCTHVELFSIYGGAHLLLVVAGYSFARFGLSGVDDGVTGRILRSGTRIAVPAMLWLTFRAAVTEDVGLTNVLLINNYLTLGTAGYWFIEALVGALLLLSLLFAIPAVRRFERRHRFAFAASALLVALLFRVPDDPATAFNERDMSTHSVLWFLVLGWLAHRATAPIQQAFVVTMGVVLLPDHFEDPIREGVVLAGLVLLLFVPRLSAPKPMAGTIAQIANASLYIYLTHYAVFPALSGHLPPLVIVAVALVVGIGAAWLAGLGGRLLTPVRRRSARPGSPPWSPARWAVRPARAPRAASCSQSS
ncbi:MAG TPA: AMP-binding protein [Actinophytocola sp.]|uniref:AMP-binding protein n=1 Tax=Actinophytocola sp. TaxID=1872138 RepID=UPI002DDCA69F|nr:AMP-binding protein [Actinophytocola sp.]HEV2781786.1 AMP-binding protein [Actinophytocola sp.]